MFDSGPAEMHTSRLLNKVSMCQDVFKNSIQVGCHTKFRCSKPSRIFIQVGWTASAQKS